MVCSLDELHRLAVRVAIAHQVLGLLVCASHTTIFAGGARQDASILRVVRRPLCLLDRCLVISSALGCSISSHKIIKLGHLWTIGAFCLILVDDEHL